MSTDNSDTEADNDVPPVASVWGRAVSEWVVYGFVVVTVIAVIFGYIVGGERDVQAERAMATLAALAEEAESRAASGSPLICDNSLLDSAALANDYLTLTISKAPIDEDDKSLGYGPALYVDVEEEKVSGDTWDTAKRLMNLVKEAGKEAAKEAEKKEAEMKEAEMKEAEANEDSMDRQVRSNVALEQDAEDSDKGPKSALREVRKTGFEEDEEYLRYYILASEIVTCSEQQQGSLNPSDPTSSE